MLQISSIRISEADTSATLSYQREPSKGCQVFQRDLPGQPESDPIGRPIVHKSALQQTTGEARYCDDVPTYSGKYSLEETSLPLWFFMGLGEKDLLFYLHCVLYLKS